jgi:hypothetical protein
MSKCAICYTMQHPDYCMEREIRGDVVTICAWCETDKDPLTVTDDNGKVVKVIKKREEANKYKTYLQELVKNDKIADMIQNGDSPI